MGVRNGFQGFKSRLSSAVLTTVSHHHPNSWNTTQGESFFSAAAVLLCYSVMPRFFCHPAGHSVSKLLKNVSFSYVDFGRENSNVFALHDINVARFARSIMRLLEGFFTTVSVASYGISDPDPLWNFRDNYFG